MFFPYLEEEATDEEDERNGWRVSSDMEDNAERQDENGQPVDSSSGLLLAAGEEEEEEGGQDWLPLHYNTCQVRGLTGCFTTPDRCEVGLVAIASQHR
jgi:hypothetical protein